MTRPKMTSWRKPGFVLLLLAVGVAAADPAVRSLVARPFQATGTVVLPDRYLRTWDPITVFFPQDRGPGAGPEDHPEKHAKLEPDWPGAWTWVDRRTLQFKPAEPWPPLGAFTVRAGGGSIALSTLSDPPVSMDPAEGRDGLQPVDTIRLALRSPVDTDVLARMLRVETRPLSGAGASRWRSGPDLEVKRLYTETADAPGVLDVYGYMEPAAPAYLYAVLLREPIPSDTRATVHLRLSRDGDPAEGAAWQASFSTAAAFRLTGVGCPDRVLPVSAEGGDYGADAALSCGQRAIVLDFSAPPADVRDIDARNLVSITPSVADLAFSLQDRRLTVTGAFAPDQAYRVSVTPAGLVDTGGRPLTTTPPTRFSLRYLPVAASARWVDGAGLLERFGPQTVPLELAGDEALDLRVYKIDPLDAAFWPMSGGPVSVNEAARPPGPGEEPDYPGHDASEHVSSGERVAFLRGLGSPPVSTIVDLPRPSGERARVGLDLEPWLEKISGPGAPGTYLVGLRLANGGTARSYMRVQVTDLSLTAFEEAEGVRFVVTSLSTGQPVPGARVRLEGTARDSGGDEAWKTLAEVVTGADGAARWKAPGRTDDRPRPRRVVVSRGDDTLVLDAGDGPPSFRDNHWTEQGGTWLAWAFQDLGGRSEPPRTLCHLWTERPVYRPEEEVHLQAWVRIHEKGALRPAAGPAELVVTGPNRSSWRFPLDLDESGGVYQRFEATDRATGGYDVRLEVDKRTACSASFQTEAYRLPTFEVALHGPTAATTDKPFSVKLTASSYAGGVLAGSPVRWRVTRFPASWQPPARPGFVFASDARYSGHARFDADARIDEEGRTDAQGGAALALDPTREPDARPRTYVVEATVTGEGAETVTNTTRVDALPAFVLGVKAPRYVDDGSTIPVEVVAVDAAGKLVSGLPVALRVSRREWHSVLTDGDVTSSAPRYRTDTVDVPLSTLELKTGATPIERAVETDRAGVYVLELSARDALGRAQRLSVDLYVAGPGDVAWGKPAAGVFTLAPDRPSYAPGQTANIVLQSPFSSGRALAVIETPEGNRYEQLTVSGGKATLRVPVQKSWTPKVPIHVVLMRGRGQGSAADGAGVDLGKPATVASTTWLSVDPVENQVQVKVESPARALPGQTVPITVRLASPAGKALPGEVALWLVDQAVLSLGKEARLDPLQSFLVAMRSRLLVRDTRNLAYGRIPFPEAPGGDGGEEGGLLEKVAVRRDAKAVPYYEPHLKVGPSGVVTANVKLPDNLTVFKIRAKAISGPDRFGVGTGEIVVRQPVVAQPALPRFVRPGDRFVASAVGRVVEGAGGAGRAAVEVDGLTLQGASSQALSLDPSKPAQARFEVVVPTPALDERGRLSRASATVRLAVRRDADGAGDAIETVLPIRDDRVEVVERKVLALTPGATATLEAAPEARPGSLRRLWVASDVPGVLEAAGAIAALACWPHSDLPSLLARARAALALGSLQALLDPSGAAGADVALRQAIDALERRVDSKGLVSAFPGGDGRVWLTASAYELLVDARAAGRQAPTTLTLRLQDGLTRALRSDAGVFLSGEDHVERALALLALSRGGKLEPGYYAELARTARILDPDGVAAVIRAGSAGSEADRARARALVPTLTGAVVTRLEGGREVYDHLDDRARDPRILASEARSLASIARAFQAASPDEPKLPLVWDALLRVGGPDGWGSPDADAAALLALAERLASPSRTSWRVRVSDGATSPELAPEGRSLATALTRAGGAATLSLSGDAPLRVWVETRYLPAADGSAAPATAAGFVLDRTLELVGPRGEPGERLTLDAPGRVVTLAPGAIVEEHIRVVTPKDRGMTAIVVPLAAGLELLNPRLATSPPEATPRSRPTRPPSWEDWRDDQVAFYYELLPAGTYDLSFRARATVAGTFILPPARAEDLQDRSVHGSSNGARIEVREP